MSGKIKIGTKLIGSFVFVALIGGTIGLIGLIGLSSTGANLNEIAKVRLPSVKNLLVISEAQTAIDSAENSLLVLRIAKHREEALARIAAAWKRVEDAWKIYEPLPQTKLEGELWKQFVPVWETWKKDHEAYLQLSLAHGRAIGQGALEEAAFQRAKDQALVVNAVSFAASEALLQKIVEENNRAAAESVEQAEQSIDNSNVMMEIVMAVGVVLSLVIGIFLTRGLLKQLGGEPDYAAEIARRVAGGDLTVDVAIKDNDKSSLLFALRGMVDNLNELLAQVNQSVQQVASGSGQVSQASQSLSQGATEQAASLEEITSSLTEMSSQTQLNTENAIQMNGLSKSAKESATQGNQQMQDLVGAMSDINQSSDEIKKIVKAIDDIAFQINLLALNANVEAARAGKYGKGFAVVADEVRNLAVRSAEAVKETTRMVEASITSITRGSSLVEVTAKQLDSIVTGASKVADLAEEVSTASREQAQGLEQINTGLGQIDQVTQANTASAEECASASEELSSQAQQLRAMIATFKLREESLSKTTDTKALPNDILRMIQSEMAKAQGHPLPAAPPANGGNGHDPGRTARIQEPVGAGTRSHKNPREVIALDDDNFGKF